MATTADKVTGEIPEENEHHIRPFAEWLLEQRQGACAVELGEGLNELVDAVRMYGKGGTLTLKVKIKPSTRGNDSIVVVTDEVVLAKPVADPEPGVFFIDKDCNLTRTNPNQPALPLREVGAGNTKETK